MYIHANNIAALGYDCQSMIYDKHKILIVFHCAELLLTSLLTSIGQWGSAIQSSVEKGFIDKYSIRVRLF